MKIGTYAIMLFVLCASCLSPQLVSAESVPTPVRTTFQSGQSYTEENQVLSDSVMVYPFTLDGLGGLFESWKNKGYSLDTMLSFNHDWFGIYADGHYDNQTHFDEVQTDSSGNKIGFLSGTYYMVPTENWIDYLFEFAKRSMNEGSRRIVIEEPDIFTSSGYSAAFKNEWQKYYNEPWVDQASSPDAYYKSQQLKVHLAYIAIEQLSQRIKYYGQTEFGEDIKVLIASHSATGYNIAGIASANYKFYHIPTIDGYIAQAWTDTAKYPVPYAGKAVSRTFESAYMEYSSLAHLQEPNDQKELFALADPKADDPSLSWSQYGDLYKKTIVAQLLQPQYRQFQLLPWPDRSFASAPTSYKTVQTNVFRTLQDMYDRPVVVESGTVGITMLYADTISQLPAKRPLESYYGIGLPLVERGIPLNVMPFERLASDSSALDNTRVLLMSYDTWIPETMAQAEVVHQVIADWIEKGGTLVYIGGENDKDNINGWWSQNQLSAPRESLWRQLQMSLDGSVIPVGDGAVRLVPAAGTTGAFGGRTAIDIPASYTVTGDSAEGAEVLYRTIEGDAVVYEQSFGDGQVLVVGIEPSYFASSLDSAQLIRDITAYASFRADLNYTEADRFMVHRGPYTAIETLDEPVAIQGKYVDLFDDKLPIIDGETELLPHSSALLLDISDVAADIPRVLFASGDLSEVTESEQATSFTIRGAVNSSASIRLASDLLYPASVTATDNEGNPVAIRWEWENSTRSLLVTHQHQLTGVNVQIAWSSSPIADSPKLNSGEWTIQTNNQNEDAAYLIQSTPANEWFRIADAGNEMIYKFDLAGYTNPSIALDLASDYKVSVSPDGNNWTLLFLGEKADQANRGIRSFEAGNYVSPGGELFIKIGDQTPEDGWGAFLYSIGIRFEEPTDNFEVRTQPDSIKLKPGETVSVYAGITNRSAVEQTFTLSAQQLINQQETTAFVPGTDEELGYLVYNNSSALTNEGYRYADLGHSFAYRFVVPEGGENPQLRLTLSNRFEVSLSEDGINWTVVDANYTINEELVKTYNLENYVGSNDDTFVKISNSVPMEGWGGQLRSVSLSVEQPIPLTVAMPNHASAAGPHQTKVVLLEVTAGEGTPAGMYEYPLTITGGSSAQTVLLPIHIELPRAEYTLETADSPIVIDGQVTGEEWSGAETIDISQTSEMVKLYGTVHGTVDSFSAGYKMKWDDDYLYVLEERDADELHFTESGPALYLSTASMIFLDLNENRSGSQYLSGDYALLYAADSPDNGGPIVYLRSGNDVGAVQVSLLSNAQVAAQVSSDHYTIELAIPWSVFAQSAPPHPDRVAGMSVLATQKLPNGDWGQIIWVGSGDDQAKWADLKFTGSVPINRAPVARDESLTTVAGTNVQGVFGADDADGDLLLYSIVENGGKGVVSIVNAQNGTFLYTPNPGETGVDTVTFRVYDGQAFSNTATVTITIEGNTAPTTTAGITGTAQVGVQLTGTHTFSDADAGDTEGTSTFRWLSSADGVTYTAIAGATGAKYIPVAGDQGKTIKFEVTPVDNHGLAGTPVASTATAAVAAEAAEAAAPSGDGGPTPSDNGKVITKNGQLLLPAGKPGEVSLGEAVTIDIPANATDKELKLTIEKLLDTQKLLTEKDVLASSVYEILKNFTENFKKPITLTFTFDLNSIKDNQKPVVFFYDEVKKIWVEVSGIVNGNKITVEVDHLTKYAVFAVAKGDVNFSDISGHWAEAGIKQAVSIGLVNGYAEGTFKPSKAVTRAEFVVMLMNALKAKGEGAALTFTDTAKIGAWAQTAVAQAVQEGLIAGYTDGSFRPDSEITRAEMAVMIGRALRLIVEPDAATGFMDDKSIPSWAKGVVAAMKKLGIMEGTGANKFSSDAKATRAEAVTILLRMLEQQSK